MTDSDFFDDLFLDEAASNAVDKGRGKFQPKGKKEGKPAAVSRPAVTSEVSVSNSGRNVNALIDKDGPVNEIFSIPSSNHLKEMIFENVMAPQVTEPNKDPSSPFGAARSYEHVASEVALVGHSGREEEVNDLFSSKGLDDFLCQQTATSVKVARKFQPKGTTQDTNEKLSKPIGCITDSIDHANASTFAPYNPVLVDTSPELLAGSASRSDQDILNVSRESAVPSSLGTPSHSFFESSPTMDNFPCSEDSHFLYHQSNACQEVVTDSANEFSCNFVADDGTACVTSYAEYESSDLNRDSVMEIGNLDAKNKDGQVGKPSDAILSESLSSIARGVGKFHPKPRWGELAVKLKQPRKVANRAADGAEDVNGEGLRSFSTNHLQEEHTKNTSATQSINGSTRSVRKRKNASNERNPMEQVPPKKKFSHSTRRKRRQVDKTLLETPEEEIDSRKLRIRDLIMLSEARERMSVKSGSVGLSGDNRRNDVGPSSTGYYYDDENAYTGGQDFNPEDEDANHEVDASSVKLNYHSYMKKSGRERWSKTDMELFYQAIRQFGTDFAMIQQLFPNRTRHQVHLKFKSEERKHPLQIADALVHRSKDHSHFKQVIEQLKTKAEKDDGDEPTSDYHQDADAVATAPDEEGGVKKSDGEDDQEIYDMYYDDSSMKYDEEAYDWNEYDNSDAQYRFGDDY